MDIKILLEQKDGKKGETTAGVFIDSIYQIRIMIVFFLFTCLICGEVTHSPPV